VNASLTRPLEGAWPYLWLDTTYLKVREGGRIVSRAVIATVAVNKDGKCEVSPGELQKTETQPMPDTSRQSRNAEVNFRREKRSNATMRL
jgi:transposase-like protein